VYHIPRRLRFALGILLAVLPVAVWIVLPASSFAKIPAQLGMDNRLCEDFAFVLAMVSEIAAIAFFKHSRTQPWDGLSAFSLIGGILSGLAIAFFFIAIIGVSMQGW
jgi:hypothetical protein